ncbi:MAG TPA: hypothetical protein PKO45_00475 [Rubrivivax sp.]|nr:hypothetical protein [Burkholderiales bacterium]HNT37571.1 hypothetical protein [Rubrivivax sp.]
MSGTVIGDVEGWQKTPEERELVVAVLQQGRSEAEFFEDAKGLLHLRIVAGGHLATAPQPGQAEMHAVLIAARAAHHPHRRRSVAARSAEVAAARTRVPAGCCGFDSIPFARNKVKPPRWRRGDCCDDEEGVRDLTVRDSREIGPHLTDERIAAVASSVRSITNATVRAACSAILATKS